MSPDLIVVVAALGVAGVVGLVLLVDDARARAAQIFALERTVRRLDQPVTATASPEESAVDPLTTCADCYFSGRPCAEHVGTVSA